MRVSVTGPRNVMIPLREQFPEFLSAITVKDEVNFDFVEDLCRIGLTVTLGEVTYKHDCGPYSALPEWYFSQEDDLS